MLKYRRMCNYIVNGRKREGRAVRLGKLVEFSAIKRADEIQTLAYNWAISERRRNGFSVGEPLDFRFSNNARNAGGDGVIVAVFYNRHMDDLGNAILVRVWPQRMIGQFNPIMNYDEIRELSQNTLNMMLSNGIEMYKRRSLLGISSRAKENEADKVSEGIVFFGEYINSIAKSQKGYGQKEAFHWVISEQRRYNLLAQPIILGIHDETYKEDDNINSAVFFGGDIEEAIMVRIWRRIRRAEFKRIENFNQLSNHAPKTLDRWRHNGELLFRHRDLFYRGNKANA